VPHAQQAHLHTRLLGVQGSTFWEYRSGSSSLTEPAGFAFDGGGGAVQLHHDPSPDGLPRPIFEPSPSYQLATQPMSAGKDSVEDLRNQAAAMQADLEFDPFNSMEGDPTMSFIPNPSDMFAWSNQMPASTPAYMDHKPFWDPQGSMTDMSMNFNSPVYDTSHLLPTTPLWSIPNTPVQQSMPQNFPSGNQFRIGPFSNQPSAANSASVSPLIMDPFTTQTNASLQVAPAFTDHSMVNSMQQRTPQPSRSPNAMMPEHQQYFHQDPFGVQEPEGRRVSASSSAHASSYDKARFATIEPKSRPTMRRAVTDNQPTAHNVARSLQPAVELQRPKSVAGRAANKSAARSPVRSQSRSGLPPIPEAVRVQPRTSVIFNIDANGHASTETKIITDDHVHGSRKLSSAGASPDSPMSGSSTDEDPVLFPRRGSGAKLPKSFSMPRLYTGSIDRHRTGSPLKRMAGKTFELASDHDMREEQPVDQLMTDDSADATNALREVVASRRRSSLTGSASSHALHMRTASRGGVQSRRQTISSASGGSMRGAQGRSFTMDSSPVKRSVRCVCHRSVVAEPMIQWYVSFPQLDHSCNS
jgi:hypothetical protein